jgi:hypothetical protein
MARQHHKRKGCNLTRRKSEEKKRKQKQKGKPTEPELEGKTLATAPTYSSRLPAGQNASLPHWMRTVNH